MLFTPRVLQILSILSIGVWIVTFAHIQAFAEPIGVSGNSTKTSNPPPREKRISIIMQIAFPKLTWTQPLYLTTAPDGTNRLFIVGKEGTIHVIENNDEVTFSAEFLNLSKVSGKVNLIGEQGLLGLAFDPEYATNGFFYVHYSAGSGARRSIISRFKVSSDPNRADPVSEKIILEVPQTTFHNHKGGMIAFGPDKMLYIGLGDGGSAYDPMDTGQNCTDLLGNILRINPHPPSTSSASYVIPADNPFAGNATYFCGMHTAAPSRTCGLDGYASGQICKEIYAYGARNPWRFSFDRSTGNLWLADVGQDAYEEIDIVRAGDNLGWRVYEGLHKRENTPARPSAATYRAPIHEYGHNDLGGFSISGGYVYRGKLVPELIGKYVYADYVSGTVWALHYDGTSVLSNQRIASVPSVVSFGEDKDGELYAVSIGGQIYRLK